MDAAFIRGVERYADQVLRLPSAGRHIVAHFDADSIIVYQAYRPSIAEAALTAQRLGGGGFTYDRMSWIKTSFLWMMYRSGWATKEGQERVLALELPRRDFAAFASEAVGTSWRESGVPSEAEWREAHACASVLVQWDPDRTPEGSPLGRRAIQLGLRGRALRQYVDAALRVHDITEFVMEQRGLAGDPSRLLVPVQDVLDPVGPP